MACARNREKQVVFLRNGVPDSIFFFLLHTHLGAFKAVDVFPEGGSLLAIPLPACASFYDGRGVPLAGGVKLVWLFCPLPPLPLSDVLWSSFSDLDGVVFFCFFFFFLGSSRPLILFFFSS